MSLNTECLKQKSDGIPRWQLKKIKNNFRTFWMRMRQQNKKKFACLFDRMSLLLKISFVFNDIDLGRSAIFFLKLQWLYELMLYKY